MGKEGGGHYHQTSEELNTKSKWNQDDLLLLSKVIYTLLKKEPFNLGKFKTIEVEKKDSSILWSWVNKNEWIQERIDPLTQEVDAKFENTMKSALEYVLVEWEDNKWNSSWYSLQWGTSWTSNNKTVMMVGQDGPHQGNTMLKFDWHGNPKTYLVGLYEKAESDSRGTFTLSLRGCQHPEAPQCQIEKQTKLTDGRVQIKFK